ncbi:hypothetical protein [Streptomyces sp. NPDC005805]|uniref:hypothetical protein n=1 Tax=Streptomyces sp. NPDC005805 TaxID=3157068 RepID=UPI00340C1E25
MADMDTWGNHRTALTPAEAAEFARALHEAPGPVPCPGPVPFPVVVHTPGASSAERREALREVYGAIVARLGEPTLYGGSAHGPCVRWRDSSRTVLLSGDVQSVGLSVHDTATLEREEHRRFAWSGPSGEEPFDAQSLPYVWQLDRGGPGERPPGPPPARSAVSLDHFGACLEVLLASWVEQLPVQVGADWASFTLTSTADRGRQLVLSYSIEDGLHAAVDDRDAPGVDLHTHTMRARGWQSHDRGWWQTEYPAPDRADAAALAGLVVNELRARGTVRPEELRARDASCKDRGELRLPGLGIRH